MGRLENLRILDEEFRRAALEPTALPTTFYLNLTERCQLRCAHCITDAPRRTREGSARSMTPEVLDALRPYLANALYVGLTHAGEPMLSPAFDPLLDLFAEERARTGQGPIVHLLSNGLALDEARFVDVARRGVRSLSLSIDGLTAGSNDLLRIGSKASLLLPRARALAQARTREGLDVRIGISWTVTRTNLAELEEAVRFCREAGLDWLKLEEVVPVNDRARAEEVPTAELEAGLERALYVARDLGLPVLDHTRSPRVWKCDGDGGAAEDPVMRRFALLDDYVNRLDILPCRAPWEVVCVEPNGDVKPLDFHRTPAGNVLEEELSDIVRSPPFVALRMQAIDERRCARDRVSCPPRDPDPGLPGGKAHKAERRCSAPAPGTSSAENTRIERGGPMSDRVIGKNSGAAAAYVYRDTSGESKVNLSVTVKDEAIRRAGVPHDGYEKVFALVPTKSGEWKRVDLKFSGSGFDRGGGGPTDNYHLSLSRGALRDVKLDDLRSQGVAFGIEVSAGHGAPNTTLWLQGWGDNYKLRE